MEWVDRFGQAVLDLDEAISAFSKSDPDLEQACEALVAVNRLKGELGIVYQQLEAIVSQVMDQVPEIQLSDGSKVEKRSASDRKAWKHADLATEVARRLSDMSVDLDTGEIVMSPEEMVVKVLDFVQPSYWRVKELNKIGITADRFCEVGEPKESIIVRKAK